MDKNYLTKVEKILNIKFTNINYLEKALTHKSVTKISDSNNERLEFIGDRVLGLIIATKLSNLYPNDAEGSLDKKLASLVNKNTCSLIIEKLDLGKYVLLSSSQKKNKIGHKKIYGDLCESLIGAVYLDKGFFEANKFVLSLWKESLKKSTIVQIDSKTQLQEHSLKIFKTLPIYKNLSNKGPSHKPSFRISVKITDSKLIIGEGSSKKKAEQSAASRLLKSLNL